MAIVSSPDKFVDLFFKELDRIGVLDDQLGIIEKTLLDPAYILKIKDDELILKIYNAINARRETSMRFTLRVFELGIKTKLMEKLTGGGRPAYEAVPNQDPKAAKMRELLRESMDHDVGAAITNP